MTRVYLPSWCEEKEECKDCNFQSCNKKSIALFKDYKYDTIDFNDRPKEISDSTVAIYFGYCQRLASFFLLYPQIGPLYVVQHNFTRVRDSLPAHVDIPRILFDMIDQGDERAPTDLAHNMKLNLGMKATNAKKAVLGLGDTLNEITFTQEEITDFSKIADDWIKKVLTGKKVDFNKTEELERCRYCFLTNCEKLEV
jgi:hypothetical protein